MWDDPARHDAPLQTPLWWRLLWLIWGGMMAALIGWLDQNRIAATVWLATGLVISTYSLRIVGRLATPYMDWFDNFQADAEAQHRLIELSMEGETEGEEFEALLESETFNGLLEAPALCGLVHGFLLGTLGGALCKLDPELSLSASASATIGGFIGIVGTSFLAAVIFAILTPMAKRTTPTERLRRRLLMLSSPLLTIAAAWHCLTWLVRSRQSLRA